MKCLYRISERLQIKIGNVVGTLHATSVPRTYADSQKDTNATSVPRTYADSQKDTNATSVPRTYADSQKDTNATSVQRTDENSQKEANAVTLGNMVSITPKSGSLSVIVRSYKSAVSNHIHKIDSGFSWQPGFFDNIICTNGQLSRIRKYILANPENWNISD